MLNEPNTSSPANVDASIMFRKYQQSKGKEKDYEKIIRCGKQRHLQTSKMESFATIVKGYKLLTIAVKLSFDFCLSLRYD